MRRHGQMLANRICEMHCFAVLDLKCHISRICILGRTFGDERFADSEDEEKSKDKEDAKDEKDDEKDKKAEEKPKVVYTRDSLSEKVRTNERLIELPSSPNQRYLCCVSGSYPASSRRGMLAHLADGKHLLCLGKLRAFSPTVFHSFPRDSKRRPKTSKFRQECDSTLTAHVHLRRSNLTKYALCVF